MSEKRTLVDGKAITYSGYMEVEVLMAHVHDFFDSYGYGMNELTNREQVHEKEKEILIKLNPAKKVSDYEKIEFFILIHFSGLKPKEVEVSGVKKEVWEGNVTFSIDLYLVTDYEDTMQMKPTLLFFRTIIEKFVHKGYLSEVDKQARKDEKALEHEIKAWLNMHRYHG